MRVVDVAVRQCYRFNCPVCRKERYVPWSALRKRVVYEDKSAE